MKLLKTAFIFLLFSSNYGFGQANLTDSLNCIFVAEHASGAIYVPVPEVEPEYPGGTNEMHNYIINNLVIPESSISGAGTIIVEFIVQSNGMISTISLVKAFDENIGLDVLRIISEMPNWTPGKCSGKSVPVKFTLPLIIN
jgi:hypothetical protein